MKNKQKIYDAILQDKDEKRVIETSGHKMVIEYHHRPNHVGPRSTYTGLPIWVGYTKAEASDGKSFAEDEAKCWTDEPFNYSQARIVVTGRLLKKLNLPTSLAEQIKE